jgi:hypothetical protein
VLHLPAPVLLAEVSEEVEQTLHLGFVAVILWVGCLASRLLRRFR